MQRRLIRILPEMKDFNFVGDVDGLFIFLGMEETDRDVGKEQ